MIRVSKCKDAPPSLDKKKEYNEEDVQRQLSFDQENKCYICERLCGTDYHVEHFLYKEGHLDKEFEWTNLLLACSYCNLRKQKKTIINPLEHDIEDLIEHSFDFENLGASFTCSSLIAQPTAELATTIDFLMTLHNGKGKLRTTREELFIKEVMRKLLSFQKVIMDYLDNPNSKHRQRVLDELDICGELLGFKYWILKSTPELFVEFEGATRWNRCATKGNGSTMPSD